MTSTPATWATRPAQQAGLTCRVHDNRRVADGTDQCGPCLVESARLAWALVNDLRRELGADALAAQQARAHAAGLEQAARHVLAVLGPQADRDDLGDPGVWRPWLRRLRAAVIELHLAVDEGTT